MACQTDTWFEIIYEKYHITVYKYVLASLRYNRDLADDCMQDIVTLMLQKKDKIYHHPNPGGFFMVTARNYVCKYIVTIANNNRVLKPLDEHISSFSYEENPDAHLIEASIETDIDLLKAEVLTRLTHDELTIYQLFYEDNQPVSKIALNLKISVSNVKVRLFRLRIKVKKLISTLPIMQNKE